MKTVSRYPFALIDDIGIGQLPEWRKMYFGHVLDKMWVEKRARLFTTNMSKEELQAQLGADIFSRMMGMCDKVIISSGEDMR